MIAPPPAADLTAQEMRVIEAIFVDDPALRIGTACSDINAIRPIKTVDPTRWEFVWSRMHPINRMEHILLARKVIAAIPE